MKPCPTTIRGRTADTCKEKAGSSVRYGPLLTTRLTLPLCSRCVPRFGFCEATRPFFALVEKTRLIFPAVQKCALSVRFAAASVLPVTFGTMQFSSVNSAVTERPWSAVSLHGFLPTQAPLQPAKLEPVAAFAFSVTAVPKVKSCEHVVFVQLIPFGVLVTLPAPLPVLCTVTVCGGGWVYVNVELAGETPADVSLSTVESVTDTVPTLPGGVVTVTVLVEPQSSSASWLVASSASTPPKETLVTQPRFSPVIVSWVPPVAGPESGVIESICGLPGGKRMNSSDVSPLSELGCEQSVTVHTWVSTTAGFCATVWVVSFVSLLAVRLNWVPNENWVATSAKVTIVAWLAKPEPSISIGVPPVSGPAGCPEVGPPVATTLETVGTPAYVAFTGFDRPAAVVTLTETFVGPSVSMARAGATSWISVPVSLTMLKNCCEAACVGSPKLTQSSAARFRPAPRIVTSELPFSLASEPGPFVVEIDEIVGVGT